MTAVPPDSTLGWRPEDLPIPLEQLSDYSYVVIEEVVGRLALLRSWPWPQVDPFGRLVWVGDSEQDTAAAMIDIDLLRAQLYTPNRLQRRPRCGDTFAVQGTTKALDSADQEVSDLRGIFSGAVYDISADAREAVKLAYHAGLGAVPAAEKVDQRIRAREAETLQARAARPLRAFRVTAPPRGLR
jgi:hypothetical protein